MNRTNTIKDICKIGQGKDCCRYLTRAVFGWECAKLDPSMKTQIDQRVFRMKAQGDNCDGKTVGEINI